MREKKELRMDKEPKRESIAAIRLPSQTRAVALIASYNHGRAILITA